jgi:hypothetical protein
MSLQYQKEGLAYDSSWINTDIRLYDLIGSFTEYDIDLLKKETTLNKVFDGELVHLTPWFINKLFSQFIPLAVITKILTLFSRDKSLAKKFILEIRNEEAVRGINKYIIDGNVATIWGAAHLPGIEKKLKEAGFHEVRREWFIAYHIRDYGSLLKCLEKIIDASKTAARTATTLKKD